MNQQHEQFPSALEAVFLVAFLMGVEFVINAGFYDMRSVLGMDPAHMIGIVFLLANAVLFTVLLHYKKMTYSSLFHASRTPIMATVTLLGVPVLMLVPALSLLIMLLEQVLVQWMPVPVAQQKVFDQMMLSGLSSIVTACLIAPVVEEMLFRGIILRSFLNQYSRWQAIFASALLFGFAHLNIYQFFAALLLGCLCGWLYERSRSLWPGIILHASYNSLAMLVERLAVSGVDWQPTTAHWLIAIVLLVIGAGLLHKLLRQRALPPPEKPADK
ncbi:lysostaphin resistance A-like protein [Undibacterium sp. Ji49W]|uniref:CPBP family intramembrane glutamic endopeptidase n=1 Tax=Undibacterium sp. Ji49W TaxID=3413040 RepID=UPI003BF3AD9B